MSNVGSEEASNEDATIISELLSSAEAMQISTVSTTNVNTLKCPFQQNCDFQIASNDSDIAITSNDRTKQNLILSLQQNYGMDNSDFFNSQLSEVENVNNMHIRHVHIPYILNGELYQIQTQDGENVTVKCCHCPPDRVYRGSVRSTGNFHMHIKRRHPDLLEKLHNMKVNALLERRDRLMRNRKISHRNTRNRSNMPDGNLNAISSFKDEEKPELTSISSATLDTVTESNELHTHKLKTVFQRHQMQQREAEEMRNWRNSQYVVMPMENVQTDDTSSEQPLNYSLKQQECPDIMNSFSLNCSQQQLLQQNNTSQIPVDSLTINLTNQPTNLSTCTTEFNESTRESNSNLLASSTSVSSSSAISNHQYEVEPNSLYNCFPFQHQNLSVIKPEQMVLISEPEAIDLSMHTDSGIFSSSEDNDFVNYNNDSRINETETDSQRTTTAGCINNSADNNNNNIVGNVKWHEFLIQLENSLRDIQREIAVRNQIESNRMFLDIAKFKFLNPGFQFNW